MGSRTCDARVLAPQDRHPSRLSGMMVDSVITASPAGNGPSASWPVAPRPAIRSGPIACAAQSPAWFGSHVLAGYPRRKPYPTRSTTAQPSGPRADPARFVITWPDAWLLAAAVIRM